jgi:GNAT superfamily N-acetyltransferase
MLEDSVPTGLGYYITQSPLPDLYLVAQWRCQPDAMERHPGAVICGVPVDAVDVKREYINRIFYPELEGEPPPTEYLGMTRFDGQGHAMFRPSKRWDGCAEYTGWFTDNPEQQGKGIGQSILRLAFRLAYAFGFAGVTGFYDGLRDEAVAPYLMEQLNKLAVQYQAELKWEEGVRYTIRWQAEADYRFYLPPEALAGIPPADH